MKVYLPLCGFSHLNFLQPHNGASDYLTASILYPSIMIRLRRAPRKLFGKTLNGRLPLEHGTYGRQTLAKRISDDSQHFIFRRPKNFLGEIFRSKTWFFVDFKEFWRSNSQMDLSINFYVEFCSRTTNPEVCTTKNH